MCRNIRTLHNFKPPATEVEVRAAALQLVREASGTQKPSKANEVPFGRAVDAAASITSPLLAELVTSAPRATAPSRGLAPALAPRSASTTLRSAPFEKRRA